MSGPVKPDLSQSVVQRVVKGLVEANPDLAHASAERLEQKAKDNLWAMFFAIPGLLGLFGSGIAMSVMLYQGKPFHWALLIPISVSFVLLLIGASVGDKDVITRAQGVVAIVQGLITAILGLLGRGGPPASPPTGQGA